ncbi:DUF429 domain-containing protein [Halobellus litoreus]|uniref:DUF429 domain-containing protein n=1 Tax=Halobellus litoreus TaxID=755310 RepID=A0ABD6DZX5_9EURY|nr:DUF429 domain-containing protein [Halobellus litoreus]
MNTYVGVDGCPEGWIAVVYSDTDFVGAWFYEDVSDLWESHADAERILVDVPIGLRENSSDPRECDAAARDVLKPDRYRSVFPTPVRQAARQDSYEDAKEKQEERTDGSLNRQTWGITPKIDEVDRFLLENEAARGAIREAHPEVCFWAFAGEEMAYSKTNDGARAFWERVAVLRTLEEDVYDHLWEVGTGDLGGSPSTDDVVDAFAVALTARGDGDGLETLPDDPEEDEAGLPMEMVYRPKPRA